MADLKNKLLDYFAQLHFDSMGAEVRARFDEYAKNEDFRGNMQSWNDNYVGTMLPDLYGSAVGAVPNPYELSRDEWIDLYDALQTTFQGMDTENTPSFGKSPYNSDTKKFINDWFEKTATVPPQKIFTQQTATAAAEPVFQRLADFLDTNKGLLETPLTKNFSAIFSNSTEYKNFITGIRKNKYNTDSDFREKVEQLVIYIKYYQDDNPDDDIFPTLKQSPQIKMDFSGLPTDSKDWYEIKNKDDRIEMLKHDYNSIFSSIMDNPTIREKFLEKAPDTIRKPLNEAIKKTDYENKDSKDFLPPKYPDKTNWRQDLEDWKNRTYENHFRRFADPARGTRLFRSKWTQNIMKAFDKAGIKPTDGLEGILSKKDAILKSLQSSANATEHFNWFVETLEKLKSAGMGKAIEGALRNGAQLKQLVSAIITEAIDKGKEKEAETALEILSVAKYGLMSSRTMEAINKTDVNIFSDKGLSWNKNEGVQFVTKAFDRTIKAGIQGIGYAATGVYNFIQHRRTKIGNDISDNTILKKARGHWNEEDTLQDTEKALKNAEKTLKDLADSKGKSGHKISNDTEYNHEKNVVLPGLTGDDKAKLEYDIKAYENAVLARQHATAEKANIESRQQQRKRDIENRTLTDPYQKMIKYWDDLETYIKSHSFRLGSMSVLRKKYLIDEKTRRDQDFEAYVKQHGALRTA